MKKLVFVLLGCLLGSLAKAQSDPLNTEKFKDVISPRHEWTIKVTGASHYDVQSGGIVVEYRDGWGNLHYGGAPPLGASGKITTVRYEHLSADFVSYESDDVKLRVGNDVRTYRPSVLGPEDQKWLARYRAVQKHIKWKAATGGYTLDASIVSYSDTKVKLKTATDNVYTVLIDRLCKTDQKFIKWLKTGQWK